MKITISQQIIHDDAATPKSASQVLGHQKLAIPAVMIQVRAQHPTDLQASK